MKIEKIVKLTNNKYKIVFESKEKIITYDEVLLKNNLLYKKEIDEDTYNLILKSNSYYDIYNKLIKYVTKKIRSEKEVDIYLNKLNVDEINTNKLKQSLKENNLLNNEIFARSYINDRFYLSNDGPEKIKRDLLEHNIDINIINKYLDNIKEEDINNKIKKIIEKKEKLNKNSDNIFKLKMQNELKNLGFNKYIKENLENIKLNSTIEENYKKIKNKLEKKYTSTELNYKIKEKLYQKGYNIEEINKIINKNM